MSYNLQEVQNIYFPDGMMGCSVVYNSNQNQTMKYIPVANGEGGSLDCEVIAVDASGNTCIMRKIVSFSKTQAGVLTMGTPTQLYSIVPSSMSGATFTQAAVNGQIEIQVHGPTTLKDVRWQLRCIQNSNALERVN
jgi:hypothetical protein